MATSKIYLESNTEAIQPAVALPVPFCSTGDKTAPDALAGSSAPNIPNGFPSAFSKPKTGGGQYVTRAQMNGVVNLATVNESRRQHGGINTYNATLVSLTGGYAKGAVLDWWDATNKSLNSVISLVDSNTVDFTTDGPDGVYWKVCSQTSSCFPSYDKNYATIIGKFSNIDLPSSYGWITGPFEMPYDGYVICQEVTTHQTTSVKIPFVEQITWSMKCKYEYDETAEAYTGDMDIHVVGAQTLNPEVVSAESFVNQRHEVFLAVCAESEVEPDVDMENIGSGNNNCAIHMVSSSGQDGGGAPGPFPVRKGCIIRLFGRQGYSETSSTESLPAAEIETLGKLSPEIVRRGGISMSMRVVAYPIE